MLSEGFFRHNPQTIRTVFYVIGFLGLISGNFLLFITALIFGHIMPRKTLFGAQQATVGKGLKNFLSSQERQLKFQADKQMFFEKLLPFAVAFGVEKIWAARFAKFDLKPPTWYKGYSGSTFNSVIFANSLSSSYSSFSSRFPGCFSGKNCLLKSYLHKILFVFSSFRKKYFIGKGFY